MEGCLFSIGYWLLHAAGIFPVTLKTPKKESRRFYHDRKTLWTPWTSSNRSLVFGIVHIIVILYDSARLLIRRSCEVDHFEWSQNYFRKFVFDLMIGQRVLATFCAILIATLRRREFEQLLNDICSLYFRVLRHTEHPKTQKFSYLVIYTILNAVLKIMTLFISTGTSMTSSLEDLFWQLPYTFTLSFVQIALGIGLVYIQTAVEGLNCEIKRQFPGVDDWNLKCWEPDADSIGDENRRKVDMPQKSAKYFIEEYRRMYREVVKIIDEVNSVGGFLLLMIVVFNQTACQLLAFAHHTLYIPNIDEDDYWPAGILALRCVWCLVRTFVICHSFEIVIREVQRTEQYIASIDSSGIDHSSKMELLEFLDEIEGNKIEFMAWNILSLDYPTFYLMLSSTVTYIIIVIQYLFT